MKQTRAGRLACSRCGERSRHVSRRYDLPAQWHQGDRDELEIGHAQRDPDDCDAQQYTRDRVSNRKPETRQDEPEEVAQATRYAGTRFLHQLATERPQGIYTHPEGRDPERDTHYRHAPKRCNEDVPQEQPKAGEHEPQDVQEGLHVGTVARDLAAMGRNGATRTYSAVGTGTDTDVSGFSDASFRRVSAMRTTGSADERAVSRLPRLKQAIFYDGLHDQRRGQALDAGETQYHQLRLLGVVVVTRG
jgi:hypothetical protein